jgi:hypothetical protein
MSPAGTLEIPQSEVTGGERFGEGFGFDPE